MASLIVAPPRLVLASATAFLVAELVDWWLYTRRRRSRSAAIAVSNLGGLVADSVVFVPWAFESLALLPGQLAGKALATVAALGVAAGLTARRRGGVLS
ncbi:VUT family protein [Amycolatopsis thermoflava]|uniref:VUT family protein n=1 Tax=Amycolatopsis thermoflava TaxID=84480 RepID=UPI003830D17E